MKFQMPATLDGLSLTEIQDLLTDARLEGAELAAVEITELTDEQADDLIAIDGHILALTEREATDVAAAEARNEALAAARGRVTEATAPAEPESVVEVEPEAEVVIEVPNDAAEIIEQEAVVAAGTKRPTVAAVAGRGGTVVILEDPSTKPAGPVMIAAANISEIEAGSILTDMTAVADAFIKRSSSFASAGDGGERGIKPGAYTMSRGAQRFGVAKIQKPDNEFTLTDQMSAEDQFSMVMAAAKESRLPGGSLVAAGGWCSPSEQVWGFCELESTAGLLSIPEVTAKRGGISFTRGPSLAELLADADFGFIQTEAQAIAGTVKPCYAVECPPWEEVRLRAIGFCITAGLLTNAAYPELVRRVLNLGGVAHARRLNAATIAKISSLIGTAINWVEVGTAGHQSSTSDVLDALDMQAMRIRYLYSMDPNTTIEGIAPLWFAAALRADMGRRTGVDFMEVGQADVDRWLGARGIALQYVYDYQDLTTANTGTWTAFPATVEIMLYPAGTFVRLGTPVIDLDTVYDSVGLSTNTYTAAFFEEGFEVVNTCGAGVKVSIALNYLGASGYPSVGAVVGVSFAPPAA